MNRIIVTGATSMIGIAVIENALKNNVETIYAVVRENTEKINRIPDSEKIRIIYCNINEYRKLSGLINEKCDVFYHIAWSATGPLRNNSLISQCENIKYTVEAVNAAKELGCSKFVGTGSQAEYGTLDIDKISPQTPVNPVQPYGIAKYAAGKFAMLEAEKLGILCFWVRVFSVYGKYDKETTMISSSLKKMLYSEKTSFTPAEQKWDYLFSDDAGYALYLVGDRAQNSKIYCLGSGKTKKLCEYITIMRDIVNPELKIGIGDIPYPDNAVMNLCADVRELREDVGWFPKVDFSDGIKLTISQL